MKKIIAFLLVLTMVSMNAQHTISGTFSPSKDYTWVIAYKVMPSSQVYIADSKIEEGKFTLKMPPNASPGTYRLVYAVPQEEYNFDVLYNGKEDVVVNFNAQDGATYTQSKDNQLLTNYFLEINALQKQIIDFYTSNSSNKSELASLYTKLNNKQAKYENESNGLLSNNFIKANKPYIAKSYESVYDYVKKKKENYFTYLDYKNIQLQASSFLTDKTINYVFTSLPLNKISKDATEKIVQKNIQEVTSKLNGVSDNYKFLLYYDLWLYAAGITYNKTSDYIYKNHLKNLGNTTNNQQLVKEVETHTRLRFGAKAPEIKWNNNKNSLSSLAPSENYVIVFWSSSCSHCLEELPLLHSALKTVKNIKVLAVGLEDREEDWKQESKKLNGFTHALSLGKWDSEYANLYNISSTPTYFILDKDKRIVAKPETYKSVMEYFKKK